jgi:Flp pilus assembly pilin Flp
MLARLRGFSEDDAGNELVTWVLIAAIVAGIIVPMWGSGLSNAIAGVFATIADHFNKL